MRVLAYIAGVLAATHLLVLPTVLHYQALQYQKNEGLHHHELTVVLNAESQENLNFGQWIEHFSSSFISHPPPIWELPKITLIIPKRIDYLENTNLSLFIQIAHMLYRGCELEFISHFKVAGIHIPPSYSILTT